MSLALSNVLFLSVMAGAVFGLRLRVFVLIPAFLFASPFAAIAGWLHAGSVISCVIFVCISVVALQIGYLLGSALRFFIAAARMQERRSAAVQTSRQIA